MATSEDVAAWLTRLGDEDSDVRLTAVEAAGGLDDALQTKHSSAIAARLEDEDSEVRARPLPPPRPSALRIRALCSTPGTQSSGSLEVASTAKTATAGKNERVVPPSRLPRHR